MPRQLLPQVKMPLRTKLHSTLRRIWRPLGRARRSRGFGVHSPFAFRFITFVLRGSKSVYYATPQIHALSKDRRRRRRLNLLFRIVCDRAPQTLILPPDLPEAERRVILMADSRLTPITPDEAEHLPATAQRLLLCLPALTPETLTAARRIISSENSTLILLDAASLLLPALMENIDHVMTFTNGRSAVMVGSRALPRQSFEIDF